jgi:hypothetical protein
VRHDGPGLGRGITCRFSFVDITGGAMAQRSRLFPTGTLTAAHPTVNLTNNRPRRCRFVPGGPATAMGAALFTTEAAASGARSLRFTPDAGRTYQSATSESALTCQRACMARCTSTLHQDRVPDDLDAYMADSVSYNYDAVLVYSTIDPILNANPATYGGARVSNNTIAVADEGFVYGWLPQYFLINGKAYPDTGIVGAGVVSPSNLLLRFVNAGLDTVVPTLDGGLYMDVVAEDGNLCRWRSASTASSCSLARPSTRWSPSATRPHALYDRALNLTNGPASRRHADLHPGRGRPGMNRTRMSGTLSSSS